jgi:DNA invertase Pin-like site-specific DNA recombinase
MDGVAAYYRISKARDGMKAPEVYEDEIRRYCSYRALNLKTIFSDIDYSGYNRSEDRPALKDLVRRRAEFSAVIVPKLSRFGRSLKHLTQLFETFDRDGIALVFLDLGMDTSTSQGRLLRNVMAAFAEYESAVRGDYTRANMRYAAKEGLPFGGRPPLGYRREGKTYTPDASTSEVIREIFQRYVEGQTQTQIAVDLTHGEAHLASLACWTPGRIGRILDNPSYGGLLPVDGDLRAGAWTPLIDADTWSAVFEKRKATREKWSRPRLEKRLLAGIIFCGVCGRKAYYTARGEGPGRYRCGHIDPNKRCSSSGMNSDAADAFVTQAFLERVERVVMQGSPGSFLAIRQWEVSSVAERRMLLAAAMDSIWMVPRKEATDDCHVPKRKLEISWRPHLAVVEPCVQKGPPGTGRPRTLIRDQLRDLGRQKEARSRKASAYYTEWAGVRRRLAARVEARAKGSNG